MQNRGIMRKEYQQYKGFFKDRGEVILNLFWEV